VGATIAQALPPQALHFSNASPFFNNLESCFLCYSDAGELYAKKLANFVEKRMKSGRAACVSIVFNK